jgi:alcohol dehydrogenase class IV
MSNLKGQFTFLPLEQVQFGAGSVEELAHEVERVGGERVLLITGNSLATKTDVIQRISTILGPRLVGTYIDIRQHAPKSGITKAADLALTLNVDTLVSVGGGSPIDATKAVAYTLAQKNGGIFLPHIAIPTTLSAAEFAHSAGFTDEESNTKVGIADTRLTPRTIILDAELTLSTPMQLWLSTGIRALDHAVETLYAPGIHPINDTLALDAIRRLFTFLPRSKAQPDDVEARTELQIAAWMSMFSVPNAQLGLSHNLGRRMGATYNVPHGVTSCITLPVVMHALVAEHSAALSTIACTLHLPGSDEDTEQAAHAAANAVASLIRELGLPHQLREVGIGEENIHDIAVNTVGEGSRLALAETLLRQML